MTYCTNCHMGVAKYPGGLCFYCHGLPAGILARDYPQYYPPAEAPCTDARCTHRRGESSFNYRQHYFTDPNRVAWGAILSRRWDDNTLRQLGLAPPPILDFSQLGEACATAAIHDYPQYAYNLTAFMHGKEWTPEEQAILAQRNPEAEHRTCTICKQPIVDGYCRCIIG